MSSERGSYLCARDPTFLWGINYRNPSIKIDLNKEQFTDTESTGSNEEDRRIRVFLRIKKQSNFPHRLYVIKNNTLLCNVPKSALCVRNIREDNSISKKYEFTKIFLPDTTQKQVFDDIVRRQVFQFLNGCHSNLFTYGISGSGKTFTISGSSEQPGIIPRALEYLFRSLSNVKRKVNFKPTDNNDVTHLNEKECKKELIEINCILKKINNLELHENTYRAMQNRLLDESSASIDTTSDVYVSVWVSFAEIYNEYIYDLLAPEPNRGESRQKLKLGYDSKGCFIKDLTNVCISSGLEAYQILQYGLQKLKYASTSVNEHSSRSHSIFTIKLVQASNTISGTAVTYFNFCDLAGSERLKKTHNSAERLKESNNINTSLLVLGRCIHLIRESHRQKEVVSIPFRESKLTQLFQNALLGKENCSFIVNINLEENLFDENQHVLNFSAVAKDVIVKSKIPTKVTMPTTIEIDSDEEEDDDETNEYIEQLTEKIFNARSKLEEIKEDGKWTRANIAKTYSKIIDDTHSFWKERYQKLEAKLFEKKIELRNESSNSSLSDNDSSSIIEVEQCEDQTSQVNEKLDQQVKLQIQLAELQNQSISNNVEIEALKKENVGLQRTLDDATKFYCATKSKYENTLKRYTEQISRQKNELEDLDVYFSD